MEQSVVAIASRKLAQGGAKVQGPRLGTGGAYGGLFLWDTAFTVLWAKYHRDVLPVERSLDNLYRLQEADGFICREFTAEGEPLWPRHHPIAFAPPVLAWAELDLHALTGDLERIHRVYPILKNHHRYCCRHFQRDDGLFIGDPWGSGMDNLPRCPREFTGDGGQLTLKEEDVHPSIRAWFRKGVRDNPRSLWNQQGRFIDMSAQMAFNAGCLSSMAGLVGAGDESRMFAAERAAIGGAINERCWDDTLGFYFDLGYGRTIPRFHIGAYWTLMAGIVPPERVERLVSHLTGAGRFASSVPVSTLANDDPDYLPDGGYWRGSSWPPTTYMVLRGLRVVGREALALELAEKYLDAVRIVFRDTGTFWENLSPKKAVPGSQSQPDFCGWAGLGPVAVAREFR